MNKDTCDLKQRLIANLGGGEPDMTKIAMHSHLVQTLMDATYQSGQSIEEWERRIRQHLALSGDRG